MRVVVSVFVAVVVFAWADGARAADPEAGARVFKTQCGTCHTLEPGKKGIGPSLIGVVGRPSSQVEGFRYSAANQNAHLVWDEATLDKYITSPRTVVPGTIMTYAGLKNDAQRADLIAFLKTLK